MERQAHLRCTNKKNTLSAPNTEIQVPTAVEDKKGLSLLANKGNTAKLKDENISVKINEISAKKNEHKHGNGVSNRRVSITCTSGSATHDHRKSESPRSPPLEATLNLTDMKSSNGRSGLGVNANEHGQRHGSATIGGTFLANGLFLPAESSLHAYTHYPYMDTFGGVNSNVIDSGMPLYNNMYSFGSSGLYNDAFTSVAVTERAAAGPSLMTYPTGTTDWNSSYFHGQAHFQAQPYNEVAGHATNPTYCSSINNTHYGSTGTVNINAWLSGQPQTVQHGDMHEFVQPHASVDVVGPGIDAIDKADMTVPQYNHAHAHETLPYVIEEGQEHHYNGQIMNPFIYDGDVKNGMNFGYGPQL